jgi:hypothetical protein
MFDDSNNSLFADLAERLFTFGEHETIQHRPIQAFRGIAGSLKDSNFISESAF